MGSSLLFPELCIICGRTLLKGEKSLCRHCLHTLPRTNFHKDIDSKAARVFYGKCEIEKCACFSFFGKGSEFRKIIHMLKYDDYPKLAYNLGYIFAQELKNDDWHKDIDLITPVPLHFFKFLIRGYNQSEWIARGVSDAWGVEMKNNILKKVKHTSSQTKKQVSEKFDNIKNAYKLSAKHNALPVHILLVDDVMTSGSTLETCVTRIKEAYDIKISILTLAYAE